MNESHKLGPDKTLFTFVHGNQHRVVHADGVWLTLTPNAQVQIGVFSLLVNRPKKLMQRASPSTGQQEVVVEESEMEEGVTQQFEVDILMSVDRAKFFRQQLDDFLKFVDLQTPAKNVGFK